jgi:hypothetical protein
MAQFGDQDSNYYDHPTLVRVTQVDIPQAGGWIYQFKTASFTTQSFVFVPNMGLWAAAIADAIVAATGAKQATQIGLDLSHPSDVTQHPPN